MTVAVRLKLYIDGHEEKIWAYDLDGDDEYDLVMGRPWMTRNVVTVAPAKTSIFIHSSRTRKRSRGGKKLVLVLRVINAAAHLSILKRSRKDLRLMNHDVRCLSSRYRGNLEGEEAIRPPELVARLPSKVTQDLPERISRQTRTISWEGCGPLD